MSLSLYETDKYVNNRSLSPCMHSLFSALSIRAPGLCGPSRDAVFNKAHEGNLMSASKATMPKCLSGSVRPIN